MPAHGDCTGSTRRSTLDEKGVSARALRDRAAPRLRSRSGSLWSPGYFRADSEHGAERHAGRVDRVVGRDRRAVAGGGGAGRDASGAAACSAIADARPGRRVRRASWCSPPISSSSRPPAASRKRRARARAGDEVRTVIAGYHWFTDWGRDTMISLEGLTLVDRPACARRATSCAPSRTTCATA